MLTPAQEWAIMQFVNTLQNNSSPINDSSIPQDIAYTLFLSWKNFCEIFELETKTELLSFTNIKRAIEIICENKGVAKIHTSKFLMGKVVSIMRHIKTLNRKILNWTNPNTSIEKLSVSAEELITWLNTDSLKTLQSQLEILWEFLKLHSFICWDFHSSIRI